MGLTSGRADTWWKGGTFSDENLCYKYFWAYVWVGYCIWNSLGAYKKTILREGPHFRSFMLVLKLDALLHFAAETTGFLFLKIYFDNTTWHTNHVILLCLSKEPSASDCRVFQCLCIRYRLKRQEEKQWLRSSIKRFEHMKTFGLMVRKSLCKNKSGEYPLFSNCNDRIHFQTSQFSCFTFYPHVEALEKPAWNLFWFL